MRRIILAALLILVLSACRSDDEAPLEDASVYISSAVYDTRLEEYTIEYSVMLNYDLQYTATLYNSENEIIGKEQNKSTSQNLEDIPLEKPEGAFWIDDSLIFEPGREEPADEIDTEVYLEVVLKVDDEKNINDELIYRNPRSQVVVGSADELAEHYKDSERVKIDVEDVDTYTMILKSSAKNLEVYPPNIAEADEKGEVATGKYSSEFISYNEEFYTSFKKYLDLIGYNFEVLATDGFNNQNIVEDLAIWTEEFNELLDTYNNNSVPVTPVDEELHSHTMKMISEQRSVNSYVLQGLSVLDSNYFLQAESHLNNVTDLYLVGDELVNN